MRGEKCSLLLLTPSEDLALEISSLFGGEVIWIPILGFEPVDGWEERLEEALRSCGVVGFTSPRGVEVAASRRDLFEDVIVYAVGPTTAQAVSSLLGVEPRMPSRYYSVQDLVEQAREDGAKCIVLARSQAASSKPQVEGIEVREVALYRPIVRSEMVREARSISADVAIITSSLIARAYCSGDINAKSILAIGRETGREVLSRCPPLPTCIPRKPTRKGIARSAHSLCRLVEGLHPGRE
ncbi:MAG: uroporphyrinogen-III synthase [Aeropyrum sp.]|nr:uroporphyrinogen-III synthase [Aeropyrum sp.]